MTAQASSAVPVRTEQAYDYEPLEGPVAGE
jgi:hypothetical protein